MPRISSLADGGEPVDIFGNSPVMDFKAHVAAPAIRQQRSFEEQARFLRHWTGLQ